MQAAHPAFTLIKSQAIPSLNIQVEEYQHKATGAQHIHLSADNPENVFLVALRTVPEDSTGVAHILEHTALCGSKKYPVRDPFFMMTRRSLNTFMNAMTSSDWTAYPFASVNRKDFGNLLDVYLDAVFFSSLDELDFSQEGHRLEFAEIDNPKSALTYKGVVFNEMKGAMSSVTSMLWQTLGKYLHPETTYHFNSGGEPECIPNLSYPQLLEFYQSHYHPSNSVFMTYGDIPAEEHHQKFEEQALKHFERQEKLISVPDETRYFSPIKVQEAYPLSAEESAEDKTHVVVAWLLGHSANILENLTGQLLSSVLLDNSASPLLHALETTKLGSSPSVLTGVDDSQKEIGFMCGLEGCAKDTTEQVESLVLDTLRDIAEKGVPQSEIEAALHQLELHLREVGGDGYPYGLQLILSGLTAATHRGDPVSMLDVDATLNTLRDAISNPDFIKEQIQKRLLDNPHRVTLSLVPDQQMAARKEAAEQAKLESIKSALSDEQAQEIVRKSKALEDRQAQKDDESILPKVTLADVPKEEPYLAGTVSSLKSSNEKISKYEVGSNGLVYQQIIFDLPELTQDQLNLLNYYTASVTELGVGTKDYMDAQRWQASVSGSFSAFSVLRNKVDNIHESNNFIAFSGKALVRNHEGLCDLMANTIDEVKFDEHDRILELLTQIRDSKAQSVTGNGHVLAMNAASSGMCAIARRSHETGGLESIKRIKALHKELQEKDKLESFCSSLAGIHQAIKGCNKQHLLIGEADHLHVLESHFSRSFDSSRRAQNSHEWQLPKVEERVQQAWLTNTQVNFCSKAYPTVAMTHPDSAPLVILGNVLRNGFLHTQIREKGGAYGGGAGQDNNIAAFRFYSYRDPRLTETLNDFDRSIEWLMNENIEWQAIEEAILGTISSIDKPESPAGRAKRFFHADLHGRSLELRQLYRERILSTTLDDLRRVAETYLKPENASTAVITDNSKLEQIKDLNLNTVIL